MTLDKQEITQKIKKVIEDEREMKIDSADQQLDIDSFTMMLVIMFVKDELGVQLDMEKLDFDAFTSLDSLSDLVLATAKA
jgi:acyl carrier protein